MAITALTDVETLEVSLVPAGANKKKRFPVMKSLEKEKMSDILHAVIDAPSSEDNQFETVLKSADINEETAQALKGAMKILNAYSDTLSSESAVDLLAKGLGVNKAEEEEADKADEDEEKVEKPEGRPEDYMKAEEESEKEHTEEHGKEHEPGHESEDKPDAETSLASEIQEEKEEEEEKGEDMAEKSIQKSLNELPENVRGQMTALWKSNRDAIAKAEKLEKSLKVERDERLRKEYVSKAEKEFPHIPGKSSEELGIMLKTLASVAPKVAEDLETVFKSVSTTIEKADLFKEFGTNTETSGGANAYAKLDTMAKQVVQKSGGSYALAFEQVMKKHPELYSQYLEEQGK
tara:strand:+ start:22417 stop:23463 length:1047 start_codon:yes stop_codon:yes gene_type:complete